MDGTSSLDEPEESDRWWQARPPALVPVLAADVSGPLRGRRAMVAHPESGGFAVGLRIVTEPHREGGQVQLGLLDDASYYRALITGAKTPSQAWEIALVYVEERLDLPAESIDPTAGRNGAAIGQGDRPPIRWPRRPEEVLDLIGARAVVTQPAGPLFDQRVMSGLAPGAAGTQDLQVVPEFEYYRFMLLAELPEVELLPSQLVWIE